MSDDIKQRLDTLARLGGGAAVLIDAKSRIEALEAELASLLRRVKVTIPTETMEQEFQAHYRRGYADASKNAQTQLAETKSKLDMADATMMLERGAGIDTHATMLALSKKINAENFSLKAQLAAAREALDKIASGDWGYIDPLYAKDKSRIRDDIPSGNNIAYMGEWAVIANAVLASLPAPEAAPVTDGTYKPGDVLSYEMDETTRVGRIISHVRPEATPTREETIEQDGWEWCFLEIMGHRSHWGRSREEERFGAKMIRIDVPIEGDPEKGWLTHYYGGASIFSYSLADEATVMKRNKPYERPSRLSLPAPEEGSHDYDEEPF